MNTTPLKAVYGCKNNSHDLISFDGDFEPPRVLLGLTDKPSGHVHPEETWWPAINCGPIDDIWWGLWCTSPDESAQRGGMVKTTVYLWKLEEVDIVDDLSEYLRQLVPVINARTELKTSLLNLVEVLGSSEYYDDAVVVDRVDLVPALICKIWPKLWGGARRKFSVRMCFSPPQSLGASLHPTFYSVPRSLVNQWYRAGITLVSTKEKEVYSRAASYFVDHSSDALMESIISQCGSQQGSINDLSKFSRLANNVEQCRNEPTFHKAVNSLRTLLACVSHHELASDLKKELLRVIKDSLLNNKSEISPLVLSNVDEGMLPEGAAPVQELAQWISLHTSSLSPEDLRTLLNRLTGKAQGWWKTSVSMGIRNIVEETKVSPLVFNLMKISDFHQVVSMLEIDLPKMGAKVFEIATTINSADELAQVANTWAKCYDWSLLHAWSLIHLRNDHNVFELQFSDIEDYAPGVKYLIKNAPPKELSSILSDSRMCLFVSDIVKRVLNTPQMLELIDMNASLGQEVWELQLKNGGVFYPLNKEKIYFHEVVFSKLPSIKYIEVFKIAAYELSDYILNIPERGKLWKDLSSKQSEVLSNIMVQYIINENKYNFTIGYPDVYLRKEFKKTFDASSSISSNLLVSYLNQNIPHQEREILFWIDKVPSEQWNDNIVSLGQIIKSKSWDQIANRLCESSYNFFEPKLHFKKAVDECFSQLSPLNKMIVRMASGNVSPQDHSRLSEYFAESCSRLAHDSLEYYWQKAGGNIGLLKRIDHPKEAWLYAAQRANAGMLDGGLFSLVCAVLDDYPRNENLLQIKKLLGRDIR